jgi:orotidine-5'-phosphate decarboxylase
MARVEAELNRIRPFKILVVTILTSFTQNSLPPGLRGQPIADQVSELAKSALSAGLNGLVCSPHEVEALRALSSSAYLVTPGVRMPDDAPGDQKRIETPSRALHKGASAVVVGRPILEANDPLEAARRILSSMTDPRNSEGQQQ